MTRPTASLAGLAASLTTCVPLILALVLPGAVAAHAELQSTSPAAGSTVSVPPEVVTATFDDDLVASKSSIEVIGPDGSTVVTGGVGADDPKTLSVAVPLLAPGTYRVRWTAAAEDGDIERGRFEFTVTGAPSPSPTAERTPASAAPGQTAGATTSLPATASPAAQSPAPSSAPGGSDGGGESIGQIALLALAGVTLGIGIGWWRSRRAV